MITIQQEEDFITIKTKKISCFTNQYDLSMAMTRSMTIIY